MRKKVNWVLWGIFICASGFFFVFPDYARPAYSGNYLVYLLGIDDFKLFVRVLTGGIFVLLVLFAYIDVRSGKRRENLYRRNAKLNRKRSEFDDDDDE